MDLLIKKLNDFSKQDFPIKQVSRFLKNYTLSDLDKKKYEHYNNDYTRNLVYKDQSFEILIVCWGPKSSAPIHGHEGEKCWAKVLKGELTINNYKQLSQNPLKLKQISSDICKEGYLDGPAEIHSVKNISAENSSSLHIYAKPYKECDIYDLKKNIITRKSLNYHSEFGKLS
tara:strand:+ start:510 stop:1025 length:516 start_codon:yes stop_codon:yes gene_type:complete